MMPIFHIGLNGGLVIVNAYIAKMIPTEVRGTLTTLRSIYSGLLATLITLVFNYYYQ